MGCNEYCYVILWKIYGCPHLAIRNSFGYLGMDCLLLVGEGFEVELEFGCFGWPNGL
jgi:hypothetical protein